MRVAVVVVNFNRWELTGRCIESLKASAGVEALITLVDNGTDPVPQWASERPGLRLLRPGRNTGFAAGNNAGFQASLKDEAEFTLFLNNDATVLPDTVAGLARYLKENPGTGIAAPAVYWAQRPKELWSAGGELVPWKMRFEQIRIHGDGPVEVDFVSGCALMVRTDLFRRIGGFRKDFFMYYEDAELCWKARETGFRVMVLPRLKVFHAVASGSGGELSRLTIYFSERNRLVLSRDMLSTGTRWLFYMYKMAVLLVLTVKFVLIGKPFLVPWIWRGFLHGAAGRMNNVSVMDKLV